MTRSIVVMGVSGCGKSALSVALAQQLGWRAIDADELHSAQAVAKMRAGQALTDSDREPWLDRVGAVLAEASAHGQGLLVACSALRRAYRDHLRAACPGVRFLFLDGMPGVIAARMAGREDHYMPISLLDSQLQTLERPGSDEVDVARVEIDQALAHVVRDAGAALRTLGVPAGTSSLEPQK